MKDKLKNNFSPAKNWKTTLILVMVVSVITFFLTITMGFKFEHNGDSETFRLLSKYENSLGFIREIYHNDGTGLSSLFAKATFYASIADYLLISLLAWFLIVTGFIINQFRFTRLVTKTRRVMNASIVLASSLILLILVFNIWIAYFQSVQVFNYRKWSGSDEWKITWETILQLTIVLLGVVLIVAMTIYNLFVEVNTVYVSYAKKDSINNETIKNEELPKEKSETIFSE